MLTAIPWAIAAGVAVSTIPTIIARPASMAITIAATPIAAATPTSVTAAATIAATPLSTPATAVFPDPILERRIGDGLLGVGIGLWGGVGQSVVLDDLVQEIREDTLSAGVLHEAPGQEQPLGRHGLGVLRADLVDFDLGAGGGELVLRRQLALDELDALVALGERVEAAQLERRDDAQRHAWPPCTAGPTGAVHVGLRAPRKRVVDDVADVADVDAPRGDVGGDQEAQLPVPELGHHVFTRDLGQVARQRVGGEPLLAQHVGDQPGLLTGVAKYDRRGRIFDHHHIEQVTGLDGPAGRVVAVIDLGSRDLVARELDADRIFHVAPSDALDVTRDGR